MSASPFSINRSQLCFSTLTSYLLKEFHNPDIEALEIVLAACVAHYHLELDPVWLFVIGPSGSGKTAMTIQACMDLPHHILVGDVTPKTFLSAWSRKNDKDCSLLSRIGADGILLMKDFTTVISKRPEDRLMIAAQLREIYDGTFVKSTGMGTHQRWSGKITLVAASTPALEREWMLMRDLGERFMTVRWHREDGIKTARAAYRQNPQVGKFIQSLSSEYVNQALQSLPIIPESLLERIFALAELTAISRARVIRDSMNSREIIDVPEAESPTRIAKSMTSLVSAHAALNQRAVILEDIRIAIRLALDSIPHRRSQILSAIPLGAGVQFSDILHQIKRAKSSLKWNLDEMVAMDLLETREASGIVKYWFTSNLETIWKAAFPNA